MKRFQGSRGLVLALMGLLTACAATPPTPPEPAPASVPESESPFPADASPAERYAQLRLLLGVTENIDAPLAAALQERYGAPDGAVPEVPTLTAYRGAGYRIASSESILEAISDLTAFRGEAEPTLTAELAALEAEQARDPGFPDDELLAEEILLVRSAVLDSLETLAADAGWSQASIDHYRIGTLMARNELEYVVFARDMDALASRSIDETTGRLDAFHRMMDDGDDQAFLRERILAAEEMNRQLTDEHRRYATQRTVRTLIFLLPAISNYFRYR